MNTEKTKRENKTNWKSTFFSTAEEWREAGIGWAGSPSRRFFCKLSSRRFFLISTMLSSLLRLPSSASTATLYLFLRTSVLAFGLNDIFSDFPKQNSRNRYMKWSNKRPGGTFSLLFFSQETLEGTKNSALFIREL